MDERQGTSTALDPGPAPHAGHVRDAEPVPHAEPFPVSGPGRPVSDDEMNQQLADAFTELMKQSHELGQRIASDFGLTGTDAKALFLLGTPMTMKELGQRMGVDPSFVTSVADALEKRGLARREPSQRDRRSKNLVLTPEGMRLRGLICGEISARAPWCTTLDTSERQCLLGLIRKMLRMGGGR
jgi:MarR family transcriptional regulator, organic hydroperoxide resistance regulator